MNSSAGRFAPIVKRLLCIMGLTLLISCMNPVGETPDQSKNTEETPLPTTLIISEYVEGASYSRALEITNIGDSPAVLSEYVAVIYEDDTFSSTLIPLSPTDSGESILAVGESFVLVEDHVGSPLIGICDQKCEVLSFNGNDAIVLKRGDEVVDSIGRIGEYVGSGWVGDNENSRTYDATLRRKTNILIGDTDPTDVFNPDDEWIGFPIDTFDNLGSY